MIRYALICENGHDFEGWFQNADAFDAQAGAGEVECPACHTLAVEKALMAPRIAASGKKTPKPRAGGAMPPEVLEMARKLRRHVEATAENVGDKFADEARKIHYRDSEPRGIYGKASLKEAKELAEEGIESFPLPVLPEDHN